MENNKTPFEMYVESKQKSAINRYIAKKAIELTNKGKIFEEAMEQLLIDENDYKKIYFSYCQAIMFKNRENGMEKSASCDLMLKMLREKAGKFKEKVVLSEPFATQDLVDRIEKFRNISDEDRRNFDYLSNIGI